MTTGVPGYANSRAIAFSPKGDRLLVGGDRGASLLDVKTGKSIREFPMGTQGSSWISSVAFSPDGRRMIAGLRSEGAAIWDVKTGKRLLTLSDQSRVGEVVVAFSPDGKRVLTGIDDAATEDGNTTRLWNATSKFLRRVPDWLKPARYQVALPEIRLDHDGGH